LQKLEDVLGIGALAAADDAGKSDEHGLVAGCRLTINHQ
jgi:hypothetical protein